MLGDTIIMNGRPARPEEARFGLDDTDVAYGYGCYETLKLRDGLLYFPEFHEERLLRSASILGIATDLRPGELVAALGLLVRGTADCNVKVMLIGREGRAADWYAFMLPALYPLETAHAGGVPCLIFRGERHFPQAKSLSMLMSTVAYREAARRGCWDALLVNGRGQVTEGTRTNLIYARRGEPDTVFTPPAGDVLEGITRRTLMTALAESGIRTVERPLPLGEAFGGGYAIAVTSTSSRVIPVSVIVGRPGPDGIPVPLSSAADTVAAGLALAASPELDRVRLVYDDYLARWADKRGHELR